MSLTGKKSKVLQALIAADGVAKDAIQASGIPERTFHRIKNDPEFKTVYKAASANQLEEMMDGISIPALKTTIEIMGNENASPSARLRAAQFLYNAGTKIRESAKAIAEKEAEAFRNNPFANIMA